MNEQRKLAVMEKISQLNAKTREILRDTLMENSRRGNFIRLYPARSSEYFDQYFVQ